MKLSLFEKKKKPEEKKEVQVIRTREPGTRIVDVIQRMYKLVISADLDANSCFVESGEPAIGDTPLQRMGFYDNFYNALFFFIEEDERARFEMHFKRQMLLDLFFEGCSSVRELFTTPDGVYEVIAERIPETEETRNRARCCVFIRGALSEEDNGCVEVKDLSMTENRRLSEGDQAMSKIYTGSYEINPEKNVIVGYEKINGVFVKSDTRYDLNETIAAWTVNGTIHPVSAEFYQSFMNTGFLRKKTLNGSCTAETYLMEPGSEKYQWYEDVILPVGNVFRVYRRNIDAIVKSRQKRISQIEQAKFADYNQTMLRTIASVVEFRNEDNGAHILHVNEITEILLSDIALRSPQYNLTKAQIRLYTQASSIHDIGKIMTPDYIINKPGILDKEEREIMKLHTTNGAKIINRMNTAGQEELYKCCSDIALHHHERFDGKGYPDGLKGDEIFIGAQAVGIADAYDALVSKRCYKEAIPHEKAVEMIFNGECGVFNPRLLESLKNCLGDIKKIYENGEE